MSSIRELNEMVESNTFSEVERTSQVKISKINEELYSNHGYSELN